MAIDRETGRETRGLFSEFRADGDTPKIRGYVAVFGQLSDELGGFREKIAPGAFAKTIKDARAAKNAEADIKALYSHDSSLALGSLQNGTLSLREDGRGLYAEIDPNMDDSAARDALARIGRGDVDKASFAFRVIRQSWDEESRPPIRTLEEVRLFEVSAGVAFPAYNQTAMEVRSNAQDGRFPLIKTYSEPQDHSETEPPEQHSAEPVDHSEPEPEEVHSDVKPRAFSAVLQEWRLEVEAGR